MKNLFTLMALLLTSVTFGQETCNNVFDYNDNNTIDIEDFLAILGLFADVDVDDDGTWDSQDSCTDLEACNYAASPSGPCVYLDVLGICGGDCEGDEDSDGICDDLDDCVGVVDECGVCNGPGPTEVVIEDITILYDSVYAEPIDQWFVFEVGADTTFGVTCAPLCDDYVYAEIVNLAGCTPAIFLDGEQILLYLNAYGGSALTWMDEGPHVITAVFDDAEACVGGSIEFNAMCGFDYELTFSSGWSITEESLEFVCGDSVSYQGYDYATVLIGDQCWFAENLRNELYQNGDTIQQGLDDWNSTLSGVMDFYGVGNYGGYYNWYAVNDARGLCPNGWHVPTDEEWMTLEMTLGMDESEANDTGYRGTDQGTQMKTDYGWSSDGNGTNSSGFSAVAAGARLPLGPLFSSPGQSASWWSSSANGSDAWRRQLGSIFETVNRGSIGPEYGFSVRCVRDAE